MSANLTNTTNKTSNSTVNFTVNVTNTSIYVDSSKGNDANNGSLSFPKKTIKAAVNIVSNNGTIFIAPGQYNENNILINKNMSLLSMNASETFVSGDAQNILNIDNVTVIIQGLSLGDGKSDRGGAIKNNGTLTIKDCIFQKNVATSNGGSIYSKNILNIENTKFIENQANLGGAILLIQCTGTITNCEFNNNEAKEDGGAINSNQNTKLSIINSNFKGNNAVNGGGIFNVEKTIIQSSTFQNNEALRCGGSIYNYAGTLNIENSNFSFNRGFTDGGAIKNYDNTNTTISNSQFNQNFGDSGGAISTQSTLTLNTCQFLNNTANYGGCINNTAQLTISNTEFINNQATENGGAIITSGLINLQNNSFINCNSTQGGAIYTSGGGTLENNNFNENMGAIGGAIQNTFEGTNTAPDLMIIHNNFTMNNATISGGALYNTGVTRLSNNNFTMNHIVDNGKYIFNGGAAITNAAGTAQINNGNEFFHNVIYRHEENPNGGVLNNNTGKLFIRGSQNKFTDTNIYSTADSHLDIQDCTIEKNSDNGNYLTSETQYYQSNVKITNSTHPCSTHNPKENRATHIDGPYNVIIKQGETFPLKVTPWIHMHYWIAGDWDLHVNNAPLSITIYNKEGVCYKETVNNHIGKVCNTIPIYNLTPGYYCLQITFGGKTSEYAGYPCYTTTDFIVEPPIYGNKVTCGESLRVEEGDTFALIRPSTEVLDSTCPEISYLKKYPYGSNNTCYIFRAEKKGMWCPVTFIGKDPNQPIKWWSSVKVDIGDMTPAY